MNRFRLSYAILLLLASGWSYADRWVDLHDDPTPSWQLSTELAELLARERLRVPDGADGSTVGAERIAYVAPGGAAALAWRTTPPAALIEELKIRVDGRASVGGLSLVAEVVLPRSKDRSGQPVRLLVRSAPARSQGDGDFRVALDNLPRRLADEARVWRWTNRSQAAELDTRGAFVERVALALPGAGRPAQVWVRDLAIDGLVTPLRRAAATAEGSADPNTADPASEGKLTRTRVTLRSEGFRIDGELYFPRVWRSQGEALASLAARGLNTVWLDHLPTPQERAEAAQHRLRILCPPPGADEAANDASWERVLAWVLPGPLGRNDLDTGLVAIEAARELQGAAERPLLAHVATGEDAWARVVDGLLVTGSTNRRTTGWAARGPATTPRLPVVRLDLSRETAGQLDALVGDGMASVWLPPQDLAAEVDAAVLAGSVGLALMAHERLDGADDATLAAARWLEAINRRLRMIEPWLAGPSSAQSLRPGSTAALLDRGGARLAVRTPLLDEPIDASAVPSDGSARFMRLTPAGLTAWSIEAGPESPGDLLLTGDPRVIRSLRRYVARTGLQAAENLIDVANARLAASASLDPADRRAAEALISQARMAASRRDAPGAYDAAYGALHRITQADEARRRLADDGALLESSPLAVTPDTLTEHFRMRQLLAASPRGPNLLHGGSFEDIDALRRYGWRRPGSEGRSEAGAVELVEADAVHGERVLRLAARNAAASQKVVSPAIALSTGDTVEITGWLRVTQATAGRLRIRDTLGGPELALEVAAPTDGWTPFRMLRAADANTDLTVTLTAVGRISAEVDGVMIRRIEPLGVAARRGLPAK